MKKFIVCAIFALSLVAAPAGFAQVNPDAFLGYPIGEQFTPHHRLVAFFQHLDESSPLVTVREYGKTYEGRPLIYAIVTSAANHAKLEQLRAGSISISSPGRTSRQQAQDFAASLPVVVMLAFGVHGNESSSAEAAMMVANHLLDESDESRRILDSTIVLIDPLQNPDGRERYVNWFRQARGQKPDSNPDAMQHFEPWPGGRFNHYLIDMNRDWAIGSQIETRARHDLYREWRPNVVVDFHEMSFQSNYFFPPTANPMNANIAGDIQKWYEVFGRANAEAFSARGWPFFVGERYDLFYPGYGDSWPALQGAVGMTYEMAGGGRAGSTIRREDGTILTLADRAERHFTTAMATLRTSAANRRELLMRTWDTLASHVRGPGTTYVILPSSPNFASALGLLHDQGIEVRVLDRSSQLRVSPYEGGAPIRRDFPAGTAVVSTRQPLGGLLQSLMERSPELSASFIEAQRRKVDADETDDFYDITAWAIPFAHNLEVFVSAGALDTSLSPWQAESPSPTVGAASFGYLIDGNDASVYRAVGRMLDRGIRFAVSGISFEQGGRRFSRGTVLVQNANNNRDVLQGALQQIASETGAIFHPVMSGWPGELALGSEEIRHIRDPQIGLVGGEGTSPAGFGMLWYTLDVEEKIPHSVIPLNRIAGMDLSKYRVLIFPEGNGYASSIRGDAVEKLKAWIRGGGTIVAIGGGAAFLRSKGVEVSKVQIWPGDRKDDEEDPEPERYNDFRIPGAAFETRMNERSYLTFGIASSPPVLLEGSTSLLPVSHPVDNIITIAEDDPLVSGFAWPESIERVEGSVWLVHEPFGSGRVITFAYEPYYRLFWRGTLPLFLNAAIYSPSFVR